MPPERDPNSTNGHSQYPAHQQAYSAHELSALAARQWQQQQQTAGSGASWQSPGTEPQGYYSSRAYQTPRADDMGRNTRQPPPAKRQFSSRSHGGSYQPTYNQRDAPSGSHGGQTSFQSGIRLTYPGSSQSQGQGAQPDQQSQFARANSGNSSLASVGTSPQAGSRQNLAIPQQRFGRSSSETMDNLLDGSKLSVRERVLGVNPKTRRTRQRDVQNPLRLLSRKLNYFLPPLFNTRELYQRWYKDILQRVTYYYHEENSFIDPSDGRLRPLFVQATDMILGQKSACSWRRRPIKNVSHRVVRVANWTIDQVTEVKGAGIVDWVFLVAKWVFSCVLLMIMLPFSGEGGDFRNEGKYDPFPYKDWRYCDNPTNIFEHKLNGNGRRIEDNPETRDELETEEAVAKLSHQEIKQHFNPAHNRTLRPKKLFFWDEPDDGVTEPGFVLSPVDVWMRNKGLASHPEYLFIAYAAKQWPRSEGKLDPGIMDIAQKATFDAGLDSFWISCACFDAGDEDDIIDEVYRMSDIVRGSKAVVIAVSPLSGSPGRTVYLRDMLLEWGSRMWTLPEALLSPRGQPIRVYVRGADEYREIGKRNLAVQVWKDAAVSRQLMDHFENSLILSPLELVTIALQCLNKRDYKDVKLQGDMAYVLMGLLLRRPLVVRTDSAFQAFARLSLANDSNMLLERLVCVMPRDPEQEWHETADYWGVKLWDIYPTCQIAGIGQEDSVVIDGALGASIRWDQFERVAYAKRDSFRRSLSRKALRLLPIFLLIAMLILGIGTVSSPPTRGNMLGIGATLLVILLTALGASPYLVRFLFTGKLWGTQAFFFGFEGYMDIETIEMHIFGAYMHRLTWAPFGGPLSRHEPGKHDECIGLDPTSDPETVELIERLYGTDNKPDSLKVFTLVDTLTMTVTMFLARRPPVAVLLCGREGGMQRAVLCSYQSSTQTLCREAVLRMETRVATMMSPVARLRFSFKRLSSFSQDNGGVPDSMVAEPLPKDDDFGEDFLGADTSKPHFFTRKLNLFKGGRDETGRV